MGNEMLFGIYHTDCRKNVERFKQLVSSDFINTFLIEGDIDDEYFSMNFELSKEYPEKNFWISVGKLGFYHEKMKVADVGEEAHVPKTCFYEDFEDRVDKLIGFLKEKGYYDRVCGFYMDEPMLWGITNEQLKTFTKYFRTVAASEKRIFVCFSLAGVAPEFWTIRGAEAVTPDSSQYLTDIAFDMYHKWSDVYFEIYKKMMERTGNRTDIKVWFIPCTMDYRGNKTEEHCLEHLENCYKLLLSTENPGGLMCYTYHTFSSEEEDLENVGLDKLTDPKYKKYWNRLYERIQQIGREIIASG